MFGILGFFIGLGLVGLIIFGVLIFFISFLITMTIGSMMAIGLGFEGIGYTIFMILFCTVVIFCLGIIL